MRILRWFDRRWSGAGPALRLVVGIMSTGALADAAELRGPVPPAEVTMAASVTRAGLATDHPLVAFSDATVSSQGAWTKSAGRSVLRYTVPGKLTHPYEAFLGLDQSREISPGRWVLEVRWRSTGKQAASVTMVLERMKDGAGYHLLREEYVPKIWTTVRVIFDVRRIFQPGELRLGFWIGHQAQVVEFEQVEFAPFSGTVPRGVVPLVLDKPTPW